MARRVKTTQQSLRFVGWGGARDGAGRPRKEGAKLRHAARGPLASRFPAHATLRTVPGAPNLRRASVFAAIEAALRELKRTRDDFRIVHFTTQTNHFHMLVEAAGAEALSRGMQGLAIRIAREVNRASGRKGKLWADRFHARVLRSPREVRNALCYVLQNTRRHATSEDEIVDPTWVDPRSSGPWFDGWKDAPEGVASPATDRPTADPQTWLLSEGWRRAGLIRVDEVPSAAFGRSRADGRRPRSGSE